MHGHWGHVSVVCGWRPEEGGTERLTHGWAVGDGRAAVARKAGAVEGQCAEIMAQLRVGRRDADWVALQRGQGRGGGTEDGGEFSGASLAGVHFLELQ